MFLFVIFSEGQLSACNVCYGGRLNGYFSSRKFGNLEPVYMEVGDPR